NGAEATAPAPSTSRDVTARRLPARCAPGTAAGPAESPAGPPPPTEPAATRAATTARPASAAAGAGRLGVGDVHGESPPFELLVVELGDGRLGFGVGRHLDEAEAARLPGEAVGNHRGGLDGAALG